jgi:hypothetical protein
VKPIVAKSCLIFLLAMAALSLIGTGCGTAESENASSRPWNAPQGWETGALPSSMNEGR